MWAPQSWASSYLIYVDYEQSPARSVLLRRLFSSFARGWPGAGLLLMRVVAAIALIGQAISQWSAGGKLETIIVAGVAAAAGVLLVAGLWTPIVAAVAVLLELWKISTNTGDPWTYILLASISAALALLGPGGYSVDARIFGWKRIDIGERQG